MIKSKIIEILKTLDSNEFKEFGKFSKSPYFNNNKSIIKLYSYFTKYYPDFDKKNFTKENAYKFVFQNKSYNDSIIRKLLSETGELGEAFLTQLNFQKNKFERINFLMNEAYERDLDKILETGIADAETIIENQKHNNPEFHMNKFFLRGHIENQYISKTRNRIFFYEQPLIEIKLLQHEDLLNFFILKMIDNINYLLTNKTLVNVKSKLKFVKEIDAFLTKSPPPVYSWTWFQYKIFKMLTDRITEEEFVELMNFDVTSYIENGNEKQELYGICIHLLNYCQFQESKGNEIYARYAFEICKKMYDNNIQDNSTFYSFVLFRNILLIALGQKEFDWVEEYFNNYMYRLSPEYNYSVGTFYKAILSFEKNDFDKSLEFFSKLKFEDIYNKSYIKNYMIMNYYELKQFESVLELIDSYRHFIYNNKNYPEDYRNRVVKFIDFVNSLVKLNYSGNKTELEILKKNILADEITFSKQWMLEKVEELEKKQ
jgi:hypothetical protein